ncbi:MAG TPA: glycosyltransferase family 39 protein, partial [Terriglobales bacterium]|nr:glycosyltransferase family 39 protein [Terriglobales bacterium]
DRAGRTRLLALCWAGFVLLFFTFSTTQEYYSMPMYPALALLLGAAMDSHSRERWVLAGTRLLGLMASAGAVAVATALFMVRNVPTPGDISDALRKHPDAYTLALGHMGDLTLQSLAYLRTPLVLAGVAFLVGSAGVWLLRGRRAFLAVAAMMVLFFHASRLALVVFDPYLSSQPLAEALRRAPKGRLIVDGAYYPFASVLYYADRPALLLNGRVNNLEYGSYAPGASPVFIDDAEFVKSWSSTGACYLVADSTELARIGNLVGPGRLHLMAESGGKLILSNSLSAATAGSAYKVESKSALW